MKAERRHDLQTNALAKVITHAPETWHQYGGRVLLGVIAAVLVFVLVRYQISSSRQAKVAAADNLAAARQMIEQVRAVTPGEVSPQQVASLRETALRDGAQAIENTVSSSDDPKLLAESLVARGDLNWVLATAPELPGAATQPSLNLDRSPEELLNTAAQSYQAVLSQYPDQKASVVAAHFGLAAIAENRGNWDEARKHYEAVANDESVATAYKAQARARGETLAMLKNPSILAQPSTQPLAGTGQSPTGIPFLGGQQGPTLTPPAGTQATTAPAAVPATAEAAAPAATAPAAPAAPTTATAPAAR
jgi:hypothetical protein